MFSFAFHPEFRAYGNPKQPDMLATLAWMNHWPLCNTFAGSREHILLREALYGRFTGLVLIEPQDWITTDVSHVALLAEYDGTLIVAGSQSMEQLRECLPRDRSCNFLHKAATNRHSLGNALWRRGPGEDYPRLLAEAAQELGCGELLRHNLTRLFIADELYSDRSDFTHDCLWMVEHLPATMRCVDIGLMTVQVDRTDHRAFPARIMVTLRIEVHGGFYTVPSETYNGPPTVHVEEPPSVVQSTYTRRNLVIKEKEDVTHNQAGSSNNLVDSSPPRRIGRVSKKRGTL